MTDYRIYLLNKSDHIYSFRVASSESDNDVLEIARPLLAEATAVESGNVRAGSLGCPAHCLPATQSNPPVHSRWRTRRRSCFTCLT